MSLAFLGFAMIVVFMALIMAKKLSPFIHDYYFIVLCKRLSQDYPGSVPDSGIRTDRFSG